MYVLCYEYKAYSTSHYVYVYVYICTLYIYTGKALLHGRAGPHHMISSAAFPSVWGLARTCVSVTFAVFNIRLLPGDRHGIPDVF